MALQDSLCLSNAHSAQMSPDVNANVSGDVQATQESFTPGSPHQPQNTNNDMKSADTVPASSQEKRNPKGVLKNVTLGQEPPYQQESELVKKSVTIAPESSGENQNVRTLKKSVTIASETPSEPENIRTLKKSVTIANVTNCLSREKETALPFDGNENSRLMMRRNALCDPEKMPMPQEKREMIEKEVDRRRKSLPRRVSNILSKHLNLNIEEDLI